ncbi:MAG TPA: GGDEF domain-containing protein [Acidimicrobiales bacterium]|nr:GGDEF domain-containing protein [Acidimicrobiales bacterium]
MPATAAQPDRQSALARAYRLIHDIQATIPDAATELSTLVARAELLGWGDVVRAGLFGRVVGAWFTRSGDTSAALAELIERSTLDGDDVMLALGLAMRADQGVSGDDSSTATSRDADLARAVVLLEQAESGPLERISAHTACGNALYTRGLFELCDEQYAAALAVGASLPPGTVDFLLAPIMFNRAEIQVAWSSMLYQLGDSKGVSERWSSWNALRAAATSFAMADSWRVELAALGLVLGAMTGEDTAGEARRLLEETLSTQPDEPRSAGHLRLAVALSDARAGRPEATVGAEAAVASIQPNLYPQLHDLALCLAAEAEARTGAGAGLRYARRQLSEHWAGRLASLGAMRARVQAERLSTERELLSKHARLDDLTGIGNRRALEQYLAELQRRDVARIALILLDVDAFKEVNDGHGHLAGDAVLVGIAGALERSIRPCDLAVRLGGDEFAVVLADVDIDAAVDRAAAFLRLIDEEHFEDASSGLVVTVSAGVAAGVPARMAELRADADAALYRAKAGGGRRVLRSRIARAVA